MTAANWAAIEGVAVKPLQILFADDGRVERMTIEQSGLRFDFAKTQLHPAMISAFAELASVVDLDGARDRRFGIRLRRGRHAGQDRQPGALQRVVMGEDEGTLVHV